MPLHAFTWKDLRSGLSVTAYALRYYAAYGAVYAASLAPLGWYVWCPQGDRPLPDLAGGIWPERGSFVGRSKAQVLANAAWRQWLHERYALGLEGEPAGTAVPSVPTRLPRGCARRPDVPDAHL